MNSSSVPPYPAGRPGAGTGLWNTPIRGRVALAALAWVALYGLGSAAVIVGGLLGWRALGLARPHPAVLALVVLVSSSLAGLLAVRTHLLRRHGLTWADAGVRKPDHSAVHLLWQIPAVLVAGATASMVVLAPLGDAPDTGQQGLADLLAGGPVVTTLGFLAVAGLVPLVEEVVFRGIVLPALRARLRAATGITLAGAVFAVVHLLPPALPYLLVVGVALCAMAEWYRSIVPGIVLHAANNAIVLGGLTAAL